MKTQCRSAGATDCPNALCVCPEQRRQSLHGVHRFRCGLAHTGREECEPGFPISVFAHEVQQRVVVVSALLQVEAQVKQGLVENSFALKDQRDEQPTDAPVPIEKRMDGLELYMGERRLQQRGSALGLVMQPRLECAHAFLHIGGGRWDVSRVAGPCPTQPVLRAAELARVLFGTTTVAKEDSVDLSEQTVRQREPFTQA